MSDVKTPFGAVPKPAVYIAILAGGGAVIYAYVHKKNKKPSTTGQDGSQTGDGTTPSPEGQYGYGAYTYEPYGYGYGPFGLGAYGGEGYYGYGYYGGGVPSPVPQQATTNAQWSQAAISALTAQGYSGQDVLNALGPYLTGNNVTQDQEKIINAAIAVEGYPPVDGPNGYPPAIKTGGGGGGGQGGQVSVPNVIGWPQADAFAMISQAGLKATGTKTVKGKVLIVASENPPAGAKVNKGTTIRLTSKVQK